MQKGSSNKREVPGNHAQSAQEDKPYERISLDLKKINDLYVGIQIYNKLYPTLLQLDELVKSP